MKYNKKQNGLEFGTTFLKKVLHFDMLSDTISSVVGKNPMLLRRCESMAKCAICEKGAHFGIAVSHSHRRTNRKWNSNVKSVRVKVNGGAQKMYVCTSCLRSGLVERA